MIDIARNAVGCLPLNIDTKYCYTATKEISRVLLTMTFKLMLSRLLTRLPGIMYLDDLLNIVNEGMVHLNYS